MKAKDLTCFSHWIGKLAIYHNPSFPVEPQVIFITGVRKSGSLKGQRLSNPGQLFMGKPRYCVEYSPRLFSQLKMNYRYRSARDGVKRLAQELRRNCCRREPKRDDSHA